jgi:hypothetical protein
MARRQQQFSDIKTAEAIYGADSDIVKEMRAKAREEKRMAVLRENSLRLKELTVAMRLQAAQEKQQKDIERRQREKDKFLASRPNALLSMVKSIKENNEDLVDSLKKLTKGPTFSLLKGFRSIMTVGGLVGFLLTGKGTFLSSMTKGLLKYNPLKIMHDMAKMFNGFGKIIHSAAKIGGGTFLKTTKFFKELPGLLSSTVKLMKSPLGKKAGLIEAVHNYILSPLKLISKETGKFSTKGLFSGAIKATGRLGKGAAKSAFKKIPGIGAILGIIFGVQRFKENDKVGGLLEIVSGISSSFAGPGTVASLAVDALLLFRDVKSSFKEAKGLSKEQALAATDEDIKKIPVIGPLFNIASSITDDKLGVIQKAESVANSMEQLFPGSGKMLLQAVGVAKFFNNKLPKDNISQKAMQVPVMSSIPGIPMSYKHEQAYGEHYTDFPAKTGLPSIIKNSFKSENKDSPKQPINATKNSLWSIIKNSFTPGITLANSKVDMGGVDSGVLNNFQGMVSDTPGITLANSKVDMGGVDSGVLNNFQGMVSDYNAATGKNVQVNSAFRSIDKQRELFNSMPDGYVAQPGKSMHNYGYALDINSKEANEMSSMGIMNKWGFVQPIKNKEPWHIEPIGINKSAIRSNFRVEEKTAISAAKSADPVIVKNSKSSNNQYNYRVPTTSNGIPVISLDDNSINKIVIGQLKAAEKYQTHISHASSIQVNGRM